MTTSFWLRAASAGMGWLAFITVFGGARAANAASLYRFGLAAGAFAALLAVLSIAFDLARIAERKP